MSAHRLLAFVLLGFAKPFLMAFGELSNRSIEDFFASQLGI